MSKHIFITGGVVSSLGKGLTTASLGMLLERRGLSVRLQKLDPYLNIDPGTMSPYQHGEVYVLDDGTETDLDLGHYERFTDAPLSRNCSWTSGRIYRNVLRRERRGKYLGKTVQIVHHITDEIKRAIRSLSGPEVDIVLTEVGGTVGDIEGLPFFEAIRQFALEVGRSNCLFIHLTLLPYLKTSFELKTKPTQHSVAQLRQIGISPDILVCRTEQSMSESEKEKISLFCNVPRQNVIEEKDAGTSVYEIPLYLYEQGLDRRVVEHFKFTEKNIRVEPDFADWMGTLNSLRNPEKEVGIALIGKYAKHKDAYKSVYEALSHAGIVNRAAVRVLGISSDSFQPGQLEGIDGIIIPGGFGERGIEGKIAAITAARLKKIPFLGICLGMQCAVVEFARNVLGWRDANSTEFDLKTTHPVISLLKTQENVSDKGGTMRLGAFPTRLLPGSCISACYKTETISERHRHRYEFNNAFRESLAAVGLRIGGISPDGALVEAIEIPDHPWFVGVQYHPEFLSQPNRPHPLFRDFIAAAIARKACTVPDR